MTSTNTLLPVMPFLSPQYKIPFWDEAIAACMKEKAVPEIIIENEKDFEKIPDIKVTVPFDKNVEC